MKKNYFKKLFCSLVLLVCALPVMAVDLGDIYFQAGGLHYQKTLYGNDSDSSVIVLKAPTGVEYSGDIVIPPSVTYGGITYKVKVITQEAFENSDIVSIEIPSTVVEIGELPFYLCYNLKRITNKSEKPQIIDEISFGRIRYQEITLYVPKGCKAVYEKADGWKKLNIVELGSETPKPDFAQGDLAYQITGENEVFVIGDIDQYNIQTYSGVVTRKGGDLTIPSEVTDKEVTYEVVGVGIEAFKESEITSVSLPNTMRTISSGAFAGCTRLSSLTIPYSVDLIGKEAFAGCSSLREVTNNSKTPQNIESDVFKGLKLETMTLIVPKDSKSDYMSAPIWRAFGNIVEYDPTGTEAVNANNVTVASARGEIVVMGADNAAKVTVYSIGGALVYEGGNKRIAAAPGIYVVRVGSIVKKVVVK